MARDLNSFDELYNELTPLNMNLSGQDDDMNFLNEIKPDTLTFIKRKSSLLQPT